MNDTTGREYKYQRDWSIGTQMNHVRCDDWEDFKEAVANMESILPKTSAFPNDSGNTATKPEEVVESAPMCQIHKAPMTFKSGVSAKTGKPYAFWGCTNKLADGTWCTEKQWKK
jgi:hypothetical protein